ncbi:hypothetical protein P3696_18770 [Vibrio parahaemolyticus]|nr:hypothetical protein [Vibrio parahaemolyticus]MDF5500511.1 hypothetical protein [Vibrio parahaemolyticus]MDF5511245.1 hypothetical protein [Vibrio parahaemolyticus]MDF5558882.1 hypothetical protein [Vibrio parahaemolyticus]
MAAELNKDMVKLFSTHLELLPSILSAINIVKNNVSVRVANGKQVAYQALKDEQSQAKLDALLADLEKKCIRDANYWVTLPTGSWVRKNSILGYELHQSEKHSGVILRTQNNRILSFIPCADLDMQRLIVQELHKATESKTPSRRYKPDWNFYNQAA